MDFSETRNMRQARLLFFSALLFIFACKVMDVPPALPTDAPTQLPTLVLSPLPTATPVPFRLPLTAKPIPAWAKTFADPILLALTNRPPDFIDDFSGYNLGWLYVISGSRSNPFYAHIQDEALLLKIPDENERRDSMVYNPNLIRRDFVLSLDFRFGKTQPYDTLRFQFNQSATQSVELNLSKHEDWSFDWSLRNSLQAHTGRYEYFSPERINVLIIMKGNECAVFLNHDPLDYISDCRPGSMVQSSPLAVSFHLLSTSGYDAFVTIDNVKLWDLEKIPDLP
jgi:hypothetical protein